MIQHIATTPTAIPTMVGGVNLLSDGKNPFVVVVMTPEINGDPVDAAAVSENIDEDASEGNPSPGCSM